MAPVLVSVSFGIAGAILVESGLSFLGFGVQPPTPSWGSVLRDGFKDLTQWWLVVFPGAAIFLAVFTYNLVGDGLQEAMDPRLKR
jgi:peptide/nickel transport system permease protein